MDRKVIIKKRLLIIYNEGMINTQSYLRGVLADVDNYKAFFNSIEGGAWNEKEMIVFHKPTAKAIHDYIDENADSDYFLIVFCGHGYYNDNTIWELGSGDELPLTELRSWVRHTRSLIICDCCRVKPRREPIMDSLNTRTVMFSEGGTIRDRSMARMLYNKAIRDTYEKISTIGYAASEGESAGESSNGGYYSHSLLRAASAKSKSSRSVMSKSTNITISFVECHNVADPMVVKLSNDEQHPDYSTGRFANQLPFVLVN
jgi:hypothetical protein